MHRRSVALRDTACLPATTSQFFEPTHSDALQRLGRPWRVTFGVGCLYENPELVEAGSTGRQCLLEVRQVEETLTHTGDRACGGAGVPASP